MTPQRGVPAAADDLLGLARLRGVPRGMIAATASAMAAATVLGVIQGWPAWAVVAAAIVPWVPILAFEIGWTRRHYGWLALFYLLVITQGGHVIEHVVQVTQIHVFDVAPKDARGIFGALDIEWVHFVWNTWVLAATVLLVVRFRRNPWLLAALSLALWHEAEHVYLIARYIATDLPGDPGLAAQGGVLGDGLPIARPDLHFFYNVVETTPLVAAFVYELRRTYDTWLKQVFPRLSAEALAYASRVSKARRCSSGEEVVREGDLARSAFIVVRGEVDVVTDGRTERRVATRRRPAVRRSRAPRDRHSVCHSTGTDRGGTSQARREHVQGDHVGLAGDGDRRTPSGPGALPLALDPDTGLSGTQRSLGG